MTTMTTKSSCARRMAGIALAVFCGGCGSKSPGESTPPPDGGGVGTPYVMLSNVEKSAFVGTWDGVQPGHYTNAKAFEVASYSYVFVRGKTVIVAQNGSADAILRFEIGADGNLAPGGQLMAPAKSVPMAVVFASEEKAYVGLLGVGKVWAFNPTTMTFIKEIDLNGPTYAPAKAGTDDQNSNPGMLGLRDGKLFVGLTQVKASPVAYTDVAFAIVDVATDTVDKVIRDGRGMAESGGEIDRVFLDEKGDLYIYAGASYGYDASQKHGFLRIKSGETEFDPSYFFDVGAVTLDVPGGKIDYLNHMVYAANGVAYSTADAPGAASNPPDYAKDHTMYPAMVDMYARTVTKLPLPPSNGYSGTVELDGNTALFALAAAEGVGIFPFDVTTRMPVTAPTVTTDGYVSAMLRAR